MSNPMPMIVPPLFWEWFNIWLTQFLKDLYHEIKMVGLRGNNTNSPYSHTCANHGIPSQPTGIDMILNIPTSLTMSNPAGAPHLNMNQINMQSLSTVSLQFVHSAPPVNPGSHNHHSHSRSHNLSHIHAHSASHNLNPSLNHNHIGLSGGHTHTNSVGLGTNQSHSNSLGPNVNHSNSMGLGSSHSSILALGGSHTHSTNLGLGGHSHGNNLGQGSSHGHSSNLCIGGSHNHSSNLGIGSGHSHNTKIGLVGSHSHSNNHGLNGSHSQSSNLGLGGSHCLTTNLGPSGNHSHSSNASLSGSHNHGTNSGPGGNHSHTLVGGSHSHSGSLGGHRLINGLHPSTNHNLSSSSHNASHNLSSGPNLSINQNLTSSQNLSTVQNLNSSQLNKTTSHNQPQKVEPSRYSAPNCVLPSPAQQYRLLKQACRPVECYHPNGAAAATYMQSPNSGTQSAAQASLRVQSTPPQPSAPPAQQQDLSKTTLSGHNFVSQTQTQPRPQYANFQQYRATQHGSRPNSHPRQQQQPFIPGAASSTGPVMYPTLVFQPTHMGMQTFQQPRSGSPGYYQYHMGPYIGYNNPPSHPTPYYGYATNSPQLPTPNLQSNSSGGRSNPTTLGPQGSPATPAAPAVSLPLPQPPTHLHQSMPGIRPAPIQKRSHRLAIIDPVTQQDILSDSYPMANGYISSGEQNDRQTPQPEPPTHSIVEEFSRLVNEAVKQPSLENAVKSNFVPKIVELPESSTITTQPQNSISSLSSINNNNNVIKSDLVNVNDNRSLGPDDIATTCVTPVVSAISDSPVIVPKMTLNVKPIQKIETTVQSIVLDTNIKTQINKQSDKGSALSTDKVDTEKEIVKSSITVGTPAINTTPAALPFTAATPQPQRVSRDRHHKSEEKDKPNKIEKEIVFTTCKQNGPTIPLLISSVDSFQQAINPPTSQNILNQGAAAKKQTIITKAIPTELATPAPEQTLTATELLSAGIEKVAREQLLVQEPVPERKLSAFEAQAKLTQSISSVCRAQQSESKMKDINLNSKTTDPNTANGNATDVAKTDSEDINMNEKSVKNTKNNSKKAAKMPNSDAIVKDTESCENGNDETDKVVNVEQEVMPAREEADISVPEEKPIEKVEEVPVAPSATVFVPKYKYTDEQWSPLNKSGKKCYDVGLLKQIKEDPLSKNKPDNASLLEACNVIRTAPMQEPMPFTPISRPVNDSLLPTFLKAGFGNVRNVTPRDPKKDGRNMVVTGKGSVKLGLSPSSNSAHKPVIHVSLSLREDVKLKQVDSAWKPTRFVKENLDEDELKTQELYKKFRGILNKLTPQKFETLLDKVKTLEINNQKRMEGVIDLLFEKAIEEPNFSEAYAAMCSKLSVLKVPSENNPEQAVNFRGLIISKCQNQFETGKYDEQVVKMEKELAESNDPAKKKELQMMIDEENRKIRLRAVANVRFIGELYKLKMLTCKIMDYCMRNLIEKLEEEKLECLCKLLTTIGEQVENEGVSQLDVIFKKMQDIVERKSNKISSRVKFMLQDVIDLRRRRWVIKSVVDSQPKMMDQIQKEAEQQQRHIELMNASGMGSGGGGGGGSQFRRDDGGRGKRGVDNRRQNLFMENNYRPTRTTAFPLDTSKFKAVTHKSLSNIRLAPAITQWNHHGAAGAKPQQAPAANNISISSKNMYSVLENVQADPTSLSANRDSTPTYSKGASIERSTFNSRGDFTTGGNRPGSMGVARSNSVAAETPAPEPETAPAPVAVLPSAPQEPLPDDKMRNSVKSTIHLSFLNPDDEELVAEVKQLFAPQYHAAVIAEILNVVLEKTAKEVNMITKSLLHLVATNTITPDNFVAGLKDTFDIAPDLFIDIPMLYDYLGKILAPHIEKKHITIEKTFELSESIISANQGHLLLKAIIYYLNESMGPTFVKSKWQASGLHLSQWMSEEQVPKWIFDNKFEFLEGGPQASEESAKILSPTETQSRLLQLMNANETCECIVGWVKDKLGKASDEDWFMRALIQAICEHALYGNEGRDVPYFNQDRMSKYTGLIQEFGDSKESRETNCLFGIQHLIHRLEHPQGLTLEIFQYLNEHYLISLDVFLAWEESEKEPEGKGVMLKALTSFFTNIKEADNEDSGSED